MLHSAIQAPEQRAVVADLWTAEQLTLLAIREWSPDLGCSARTEMVFRTVFGLAEVEDALASFEGVMGLLDSKARRCFRPHCAVCSLVSPDEVCALHLFAACQGGQKVRAEAAARWLVHACAESRVIDCATQFAHLLKQRHMFMPLRDASGRCRLERRTEAPPLAREAMTH